jgi:hypothetical protein
MVSVRRVPSEFPLPKLRESFTHTFADADDELDIDDAGVPVHLVHYTHLCALCSALDTSKSLLERACHIRKRQRMKKRMRHMGQIAGRTCVNSVIEESNKSRSMLSDSMGMIAGAQAGMGARVCVRGVYTQSAAGRLGTQKSTHKNKDKLQRRGMGSMKMKQMYDHLKENGELVRPSDSAPKKDVKEGEIDLKMIQQKRQHAEIQRYDFKYVLVITKALNSNRIEEDIRENHPFFDRPLFVMGRHSRFRRFCQAVVYAKYEPTKIDPVTGKLIQRSFKELHELLGLMTYVDWTMVLITGVSWIVTCAQSYAQVSCVSMLFESSWPLDEGVGSEYRLRPQLIQKNPYLQVSIVAFAHTQVILSRFVTTYL